jgi:hypothetical protein
MSALASSSSSALLSAVPAPAVQPVKKRPKRFQFDPSDKIAETLLKREVRARANRDPCFAASLVHWSLEDVVNNADIFHCLWPYYHGQEGTITPTPETRLALGVVGLMACLATVSPHVLALLVRAPSRPNYEFHMVNALMSVIKYTVKPTSKDTRAAVHLMTQTLKKVASFAAAVPDVGQAEYSKSPFPKLDVFLRSFIDRMACTPRLIAQVFCAGVARTQFSDENPDHRFGYRVYGDLADALRVAPDEEDTLDVVLSQFEDELLNPWEDGSGPAQCNEHHAFDQREHTYSHAGRGPPPMLFFEAAARQGIPRACLVPEVVLTECTLQGTFTEHVYRLVAVACVLGDEDDLALEFYAPGAPINETSSDNSVIALVVYIHLEHSIENDLMARLTSAERGERIHEQEDKKLEEPGSPKESEDEVEGDDSVELLV